jgi:hypothetical protein
MDELQKVPPGDLGVPVREKTFDTSMVDYKQVTYIHTCIYECIIQIGTGRSKAAGAFQQ